MDPIELIISRIMPLLVSDPGPSGADIARALDAAATAPDHGRLRPWRFMVFAGDDREQLATAFAESLQRRRPDATGPELEAEKGRVLRAPVIIVVAAALQKRHPKIPEIEQILAGGAAVQNLILSFHAMGYGAMWKTGPAAYDPLLAKALRFAETDQIIAFLHIGTNMREGHATHRSGAGPLLHHPAGVARDRSAR